MPFLIFSCFKKVSFISFHCFTRLSAPTWLLTGEVWPCTGEGDISTRPNQPTRNFGQEELILQHQMTNTYSSSPFAHKTLMIWRSSALEQWFRDLPAKAWTALGREHKGGGWSTDTSYLCEGCFLIFFQWWM